jgi:hypothetical protein
MKKRLKTMKIIKYLFGDIECLVLDDESIEPQDKDLKESNIIWKNENEMVKAWRYGKKYNSKVMKNKRLIKIYENELRIDITNQRTKHEKDIFI